MRHPQYEQARTDWFLDRTMTPARLAERYGCSRRTAERWIKRWLIEARELSDERWMLRRILHLSEQTLEGLRALTNLILEGRRNNGNQQQG